MSDERSQGGEANHQGDELRADIRRALAGHDFIRVSLSNLYLEALRELPGHLASLLVPARGVFAEQTRICKSPFGEPHRCDFLLWRQGWPCPLALVARHQHSSGSAREKLCHLADTVEHFYPCPMLLVLEGPYLAHDPDVLAWMDVRAGKSGGNLRRVMAGVYTFRQWLTEGAPWPEPAQPSML